MSILSRPRSVITLRTPCRLTLSQVVTGSNRQRGGVISQLEDGAGKAEEGTGRWRHPRWFSVNPRRRHELHVMITAESNPTCYAKNVN